MSNPAWHLAYGCLGCDATGLKVSVRPLAADLLPGLRFAAVVVTIPNGLAPGPTATRCLLVS